MTPLCWTGRRVLITGHTGFKGSWLALWLQRAGAHVVGLSLPPPTSPSLFALAGVGRGMVSLEGDVRDPMLLEAVMTEHEPSLVIHLAAQPLVRRSYEHPLETYAVNVMGTVSVLEGIRRSRCVKAALVVTSDKCYANDGRHTAYTEADALGGADPYSSSKGAAELVAAAYGESYFNRSGPALATVRAGNVIGGGDWAADRLVPDIMGALMQDRAPVIRSPEAVRPWQHVLDCLHGYLVLAERLLDEGPAFGGPWNFGPGSGEARTVGWVADQLCAGWGTGVSWVREEAPQPSEAKYLQLDSSQARARLHWAPRLDLEQSLCTIVEWYRRFARGEDVRRLTESQIRAFEDRQ